MFQTGSNGFKLGFFFNFHRENLAELLEVNLTKVWPCPLEAIALSLEPTAIGRLQFRFSQPILIPVEASAHGFLLQ